ncbi:hypothetical protein BDV95DRAFT_484493 [Massariosphaeria phaeospora]|uniref:DUF7492 domain-containing protein n=1 Tax=Massariosphaeria phaeospora TaxID=100035 RepID=A0A7C8IJK5_9PLEO|nr:hypothetical protein BDV95DRAFT_484493 [Massariosphaeria phaeospora]
MYGFLAKAALAVALAPAVLGHSWIEQLRNVNEQGQYVGEFGYPRGFKSKHDADYDGVKSMNFQLPQNDAGGPFIDEKTPLCHPNQRSAKQSEDKYPRLQATPGGFFAMRYSENGHVTKPDNQKGKPEKGGTVFVYGTTQPKEDEKLVEVLRWTKDGQGGDKRGLLLNMNDFDDGRCYEMNEQAESTDRQKATPNFAMGQASTDGPGNYPLFCETNAAVPKDATTGKPYTLYWVWQWNTVPGQDPGLPKGKDEYYSTCIDVDVVDTVAQDATAQLGLAQQDAMAMAVKDFASRTALITDAIKAEVGPVFSGSAPAPTVAPSAGASGPPAAIVTSKAPLSNSTGAAAAPIPTMTQLPGSPAAPVASPAPSGAPAPVAPGPGVPGPGGMTTVVQTVKVTVTAPAVTQTIAARAEHVVQHANGAKFRGRFALAA